MFIRDLAVQYLTYFAHTMIYSGMWVGGRILITFRYRYIFNYSSCCCHGIGGFMNRGRLFEVNFMVQDLSLSSQLYTFSQRR